jgi:indolepyruvate ferredoxin oxidoreductase, beta subunit
MSKPIKIAIQALGGQGGGVLSDWLIHLASHNGYIAQGTSVPGVAQRTGTTIYYLEMVTDAGPDAPTPVLALMPVPGDIDIVVAAELMEGGRAILRGLVDKERTTLIVSTHRVYAIGEKSAMGDGLGNSAKLIEAARAKAKKFIGFDMEAMAEQQGSVISSVLLGALAGSGALPFTREAYEATITASGVAVSSNLKGFAAGFAAAAAGAMGEDALEAPKAGGLLVQPRTPTGQALFARVKAEVPEPAQFFAVEGVRRLIDYQDAAYAHAYLDRLKPIVALDRSDGAALTREVARYLALWMSYEDTIRVADLKTRGSRFERVRSEVRAEAGQIVDVTEYMHPRWQEICETLPRGLGQWLHDSPRLGKLFAPLFKSGRHVTTTSVRWFLVLFVLGRLKRWRRGTLRFAQEQARIDAWLAGIIERAPTQPDVALELAECQRLVKGYSDTHARGLRNFAIVWDQAAKAQSAGLPEQAQAERIRTLREAALKDEYGEALAAELNRLAA